MAWQAIGNREVCLTPPRGSSEPVYDFIVVNPAAHVGTIVMRRHDPVSLVMPHLAVPGHRSS